MSHWSPWGATAALGAYVLLGLGVVAIAPHPLLKLWGVAMVWPGPMHAAAAGAGALHTRDWGHGKTVLEEQSDRARARSMPGYCDPTDPPWWCV